jgi:hypothetical protein
LALIDRVVNQERAMTDLTRQMIGGTEQRSIISRCTRSSTSASGGIAAALSFALCNAAVKLAAESAAPGNSRSPAELPQRLAEFLQLRPRTLARFGPAAPKLAAEADRGLGDVCRPAGAQEQHHALRPIDQMALMKSPEGAL